MYVNIFSNGENCLDKMHENPDVIILDYYLDGIKADAANGLEILKKIRVTNPDVYVIMMSGQDDLKVAVERRRSVGRARARGCRVGFGFG